MPERRRQGAQDSPPDGADLGIGVKGAPRNVGVRLLHRLPTRLHGSREDVLLFLADQHAHERADAVDKFAADRAVLEQRRDGLAHQTPERVAAQFAQQGLTTLVLECVGRQAGDLAEAAARDDLARLATQSKRVLAAVLGDHAFDERQQQFGAETFELAPLPFGIGDVGGGRRWRGLTHGESAP